MTKYPEYAKELARLLEDDQKQKKELARKFLAGDSRYISEERAVLKAKARQRATRMLQILDDIREPSISKIGDDGALAMSVLASHDNADTLRTVLEKFNQLHRDDRENCRHQSIPAMTDAFLVTKREPQRFGTQWFFDQQQYPFLYPVEDFERVNERRLEYDIEPLRWPKSLAIPESEQPWLARPLSELVMREPTELEYKLNQG